VKDTANALNQFESISNIKENSYFWGQKSEVLTCLNDIESLFSYFLQNTIDYAKRSGIPSVSQSHQKPRVAKLRAEASRFFVLLKKNSKKATTKTTNRSSLYRSTCMLKNSLSKRTPKRRRSTTLRAVVRFAISYRIASTMFSQQSRNQASRQYKSKARHKI
jgi:hypothetical protein